MNIVDNDNCNICCQYSETLHHLFITCNPIKQLWRDLEKWIKTKINSTITFEPSTIILGYLNNDNRSIPLNTIILITKSYIFWCSRKKTNLIYLVCKKEY